MNREKRKKFSRNFWTVISMEFLERGAYYGVMSVLAIYLTLDVGEGGLGFTKRDTGYILSLFQPLVYFIPIVAGALADRYGYRRMLSFAFTLMMLGYLSTSYVSGYWSVFASLVVVALGAGMFKPVVAGTIARETDSSNSSLGFGIFYWSVNLGAFIVPLVVVPYLKELSWSYIFLMGASVAFILSLLNIFVFREPRRPKSVKPLGEIFSEMVLVLRDHRFTLLVVIYSGFWVLYFQMFGTVLWYLQEYVDVQSVDRVVNGLLSYVVENPSWHFDVEHVTVLNALTIISLQLVISNIVKRIDAIKSMICGVLIATVGMAILAISSDVWIFLLGVVIFSVGEMTAYPKYASYVGGIAPEDKKALYLGYSFLCSVIGSGIAGVLGSLLYQSYAVEGGTPAVMWLLFATIGLLTALGLYVFNKKIGARR